MTDEQKMRARVREYKGEETESHVPENKLSPEREAELKAHLQECEKPFLSCDLCYELFLNIGYQAYAALVLAAGPTESEQNL